MECAEHGGECGYQRGKQDGAGGERDHRRVSRFYLIEERLDRACRAESECDSSASPQHDHQENIDSHNADNAGTSCANGYADADFAAALEDRVVEDGVESDAGEEQRDDRKEGGEHGDEALADGLVVDQVELSGDV